MTAIYLSASFLLLMLGLAALAVGLFYISRSSHLDEVTRSLAIQRQLDMVKANAIASAMARVENPPPPPPTPPGRKHTPGRENLFVIKRDSRGDRKDNKDK